MLHTTILLPFPLNLVDNLFWYKYSLCVWGRMENSDELFNFHRSAETFPQLPYEWIKVSVSKISSWARREKCETFAKLNFCCWHSTWRVAGWRTYILPYSARHSCLPLIFHQVPFSAKHANCSSVRWYIRSRLVLGREFNFMSYRLMASASSKRQRLICAEIFQI